jgi:hypothetical protein
MLNARSEVSILSLIDAYDEVSPAKGTKTLLKSSSVAPDSNTIQKEMWRRVRDRCGSETSLDNYAVDEREQHLKQHVSLVDRHIHSVCYVCAELHPLAAFPS